MKTFLSMGAGVQTTAILILVAQGKVQADAVIFADTGAEHPETYEYIEKYHKPLCGKLGIPFITARMHLQEKNIHADHPVFADSLEEHARLNGIIPSRKLRWCTDKSKILPMRKTVKERQANGQFETPATALIGISTDEKHRGIKPDGSLKQPNIKEYRNAYPLLDLGISRNDCYRIIQEYGWPEPVKSGCYFCPFQGGKDWQDLYVRHPDLFWASESFEEQASNFPHFSLYQRKPLRKLAQEFGEGTKKLDDFDDYEGEACVDINSSCML